jgi:hypothetical protein
MPRRAEKSSAAPEGVLYDAFAAPHPPDEVLEEGFRSAVLDQIVLPPLTRGERWRAALMRMGLAFGGQALRDKLTARQAVADLGRSFGPQGAALTHPAQLAAFFVKLMDFPEILHEELTAFESGLAGLLIEYRYKYSIQRGLMCYYSKIAKKSFGEGIKKQKMVSKINDPSERAQVLGFIREKYLYFISNYVFACVTREDVLKGNSLFADFITALLFLARIEGDGTLDKEPNAKRLPQRRQLLFLAMRDPIFVKAAADDGYQRKMAAVIKDFPP